MVMRNIVDKEAGFSILSDFNRIYQNEEYELLFNTKSGLEVLHGINGNPDPFFTDLPTLLDIGIMGHCENRCAFCYQGDEDQPNMKLEDFKLIIDQVKDHTNQVALGGRGDPNLHPEFFEIVQYARSNDVVPNYTTSGMNLTDEHIEISRMCGSVAISDYGNPYTYEAIQRFIDAKIKTNIHLMFTSASYDKCIKITYGSNPWHFGKYGKPYFDIEKLNAVVFLLFKPQGNGENCPDLAPTRHQIQAMSGAIVNARSTFKIAVDSCLSNHLFKNADIKGFNQLSLDSCEGARMSAYITPDMKMMPCSFSDRRYAVDMKRTLKDIWLKSRPFKKFRTALKKNSFSCPAGF